VLDEGAIAHCLATEPGVRHARALQEGLYLGEQIGVGDDLHGGKKYHKFPRLQALMLGIYEIALAGECWDISNMTAQDEKRKSAQRSALWIAAQLETIREPLTERQWTIEAGVSPSFFSNLRGTPTKPPSDPSVDQLRRVLKVRHLTLSEFFIPEARGRVTGRHSQEDLERVFDEALAGLPKKQSARAPYLAQVVVELLALPPAFPARPDNVYYLKEAEPEEADLPPDTTTRK